MGTYEMTIKGVKAESATQAAQVGEALKTIANTLSAQDIIDLAQILKEKPGIVQKAKSLANFL